MMEVIQSPQKVHKDEDDESDNSLSEGEVGELDQEGEDSVIVGVIVKTGGNLNVKLENNNSNEQKIIKTHDDDSDIDDCEMLSNGDDDGDTDDYMYVELSDEDDKKPSIKLSKTDAGGDGEHRNVQIENKPSVKEDTEGKSEKLSTTLQCRDSERVNKEQNRQSKRKQRRPIRIKAESDGSQDEGNNVSRSLRHSHRTDKKVFYGDCQETGEDSSDNNSYKQDNSDTESYEYSEEERDLRTRTKKPLRRKKVRKKVKTEKGEVLYDKVIDLPPTFSDFESEKEEGEGEKKIKKRRKTKKYLYLRRSQCDLCGTFVKHRNLERHRNRHTGEIKYPCETCGRIFLHKGDMCNHRKMHNSVREKYPCSVCGKQFVKRDYVRWHECHKHPDKFPNVDMTQPGLRSFVRPRRRREKKWVCSYTGCDKRFPDQTQLQDHEASVHRGEVVDRLTCDICKATFTIQGSRDRHMLTHSANPRPFVCRYCPASFTQTSSRTAHERKHTGERPYVCKFCKKGFTQQSNKKTHEKRCKLKTGAIVGSTPGSSQGSSSNRGSHGAKTKQSACVPPVIVQPRFSVNLDHDLTEPLNMVLPGVSNSSHSNVQTMEMQRVDVPFVPQQNVAYDAFVRSTYYSL